MDKISVLGVNFNNVNMEEAVEVCKGFLASEKGNLIVTPNPEIVMRAKDDEEFKNIINNAELVIPDGNGIILAGKILKTPLKDRVAGFDLVSNLLEEGKDGAISFYFWGGKPGIADTAAEKVKEKYPNIKVLGSHHGYFKEEEEIEIVEEIRKLKPDVLLVALGAPKQEKIINKYKDEGFFKIGIGCGGTLDVLSGTVKRAPKIFIKCRVEFLYRLLKEPSRIGRMKVLPKFVIEVIKSKKKK